MNPYSKADTSPESHPIPQASTEDLRGRQSVRATFKLSPICIHAISIVATHLGIKQKSLFDHLVEDTRMLETIARSIPNDRSRYEPRVQKTYVISRRSLVSLDEIASSFDAPRDALVEYSVQRLLPIIVRERSRHEARKRLFSRIEENFAEARKILADAETQLGEDDPAYERFAALVAAYRGTAQHIAVFIEKSRIIEHFDPSLLERRDDE